MWTMTKLFKLPPWICPSAPSAPTEFISELLLPYPPTSIPTEVRNSNNAFDAGDQTNSSSASSLQDQREGNVSPELLASFQRSRSRQRVLELWNSAEEYRSQLHVDNNTGLFATENIEPEIAEFISELLLPYPPTSIPTEVRNSNNAFDAGDQTNSSSASSMQDQREGRIPDVSPELLASFQRSRSRQRVLELWNSAEEYRNQLHVDNNTGLFATENIEPEIAPLMLDHVDELELVESVHGNNGSCEVEEANVGDFLSKGKEEQQPDSSSASSPQDQGEGRIPDVSPEPDQSLASFQRSRSRQRALELRNSAQAYRSQLHVDSNNGLFASENFGSETAPLMLNHEDELELVESVHNNNGSCEVEEANVGDLLSKGTESRKEELISGRLLPGSQPTTLCSSRDHVPYNKPAFISENEELFVGNNTEVTTDGQSDLLQLPVHCAGCDSNGVPELESGATSLQVSEIWSSFRLICADQAIPEFEGFIIEIDTEQLLHILNNHTNPGSSEEVVDVVQEDHVKELAMTRVKREPLADVTENPNLPASASEAEIFAARHFTGTCKGVTQKLGHHNSSKRGQTNKAKVRTSLSMEKYGMNRMSESVQEGPSLGGREAKRNNIVSNVSSFVPLVKQKQAAAIATGKKYNPVKALKVAKLAKRLAEQKENKRKIEKEQRKAEKARRHQENMKEMQLLKKKKEDERKKKEADMSARKRQREGRKKDKEPKRKLPKKENELNCQPVEKSNLEYEDKCEDDDKHFPSWASENCLALAVSSQQSQNLEEMFTPESFCSISEVLLPRRLQQK